MIPDDKVIHHAPQKFVDDSTWKNHKPPTYSRLQVATEDEKGFYVIPFLVEFDGRNFINSRTKDVLEVDVVTWRQKQPRH